MACADKNEKPKDLWLKKITGYMPTAKVKKLCEGKEKTAIDKFRQKYSKLLFQSDYL